MRLVGVVEATPGGGSSESRPGFRAEAIDDDP